MNAKGILFPILAVAICTLPACNLTVGDCYPLEEWEGGAGAGGPVGPPVPVFSSVASGDFGADPQGGGERKIQCNKTDSEDEEEESPSDSSERPTASPTSPPGPCPEIGDIAGDGATFLSCSDECRSKCPPGMAPWVFGGFDPSDFNFVTIVADDGRGKGGGWQEAKPTLNFRRLTVPHPVRSWNCDFTINMPIRTEKMGLIDPGRAASLSEEIMEDVANVMDYDLPPGIFCKRFAIQADAAFKSKYKGLGAKVTNP
ncbi:hypothetical protein WMF27_07515 [Sorangium sp. So ce281]|uniref:hypothetical protein n=1 Tax=unclassified Sorangium TaxID=2621164 RepID=UPI003F617D8B